MAVEVSVICNAFNHEKYIRQALEGFVNQKTNFEFEVLVHDDASTDKTPEIIREYEERYPQIIKPIYQSENQYSKGKSITRTFQLPRAQGKYIAICEGDDYWNDEEKLQRQFDYLESHQDIDMCAHCAEQINGVTGEHIKWVSPRKEDGVITMEEVIANGGAYIATASLLYRREIEYKYQFRQEISLDFTLQVAGAARGGIYYFSRPMSVYRFMAPGSWTSKVKKNKVKMVEHSKRMLPILKLMDQETHHKYHAVFLKKQVINRMKLLVYNIELLAAGINNKQNEQ